MHRLLLTIAVNPEDCLGVRGGVPARVKQHAVVGANEVDAERSRLGGDEECAGNSIALVVEARDEMPACLGVHGAVDAEQLMSRAPLEHRLHKVLQEGYGAERLAKNQHLLPTVAGLLDDGHEQHGLATVVHALLGDFGKGVSHEGAPPVSLRLRGLRGCGALSFLLCRVFLPAAATAASSSATAASSSLTATRAGGAHHQVLVTVRRLPRRLLLTRGAHPFRLRLFVLDGALDGDQ
mmetsp:Transcript_16400/g.45706  ORF Transcript_16400/g.45706 Transcript_16400/m.45706 type:complete len:237 (+) Transcript_16400:1443-2153(+)